MDTFAPPPATPEEAKFIQNFSTTAFQQGDLPTWRHLYDHLSGKLEKFSGELVGDKGLGQDLSMHVFGKLYRMRENFGNDDNLQGYRNVKAFLFITTRNNSLGYLKHQQHLRSQGPAPN